MPSIYRADYIQLPQRISSPKGLFGTLKTKLALSDEQKEKITEEFSFFGYLFSEIFNLGSHFYSGYQAGMPLPKKISNTIKLIEDVFNKFLEENPKIHQAIQYSQFLSVVSIPVSLYNIGTGVRDFYKGNLNKRIESTLDALYEVGTIGSVVSEVALGLSALGKVAEASVRWAGPLGIASTGLFIAKPFKKGYQWWQNHQFLNDFLRNARLDQKGKYALQDAENVLKFLKTKDDSFLETHCSEEGVKLKNRIEKITEIAKTKLKTEKTDGVEEENRELKDSIVELKNCIRSENRDIKVSFISSSVEFVGYCFYLSPNLSPVGEGLITASAVIEDSDKWARSHSFLKEFNAISSLDKVGATTTKDLELAIEFIKSKDDSSLKKLFNVKGEKLKRAAEKVSRVAKAKLISGNGKKIKEGEKDLKEFVELLKGRIENGQLSQKLSVLSGAVSTVGLGVILAPPVAPVGYGMLIAGSSLAIGRLIFAKVIENKFEKAIEAISEDGKSKSPQVQYTSVINELNKGLRKGEG